MGEKIDDVFQRKITENMSKLTEFLHTAVDGVGRDVDPETQAKMDVATKQYKERMKAAFPDYDALLDFAASSALATEEYKARNIRLMQEILVNFVRFHEQLIAKTDTGIESADEFERVMAEQGGHLRNIFEQFVGQGFADLSKVAQQRERLNSQRVVRQNASKGGAARHLGTQADKQKVREYWDRWQREPGLYRNQEAFALDMLEKFGTEAGGNLTSASTIRQKWIPEFKKSQRDT